MCIRRKPTQRNWWKGIFSGNVMADGESSGNAMASAVSKEVSCLVTLSILKNVQIWMLCQTCKHVGCALCSQSDSNDIPFTSLYLPAAKSSSISDGRDYGSIGHSRRKLHKRQQKCNLYSLKILKPTSATDKVLSATDQYSLRLGLEYCALKSSMRQKPFQVMWHPWSWNIQIQCGVGLDIFRNRFYMVSKACQTSYNYESQPKAGGSVYGEAMAKLI